MTLTKPIIDTIIDTMLDIWDSADKWIKGSTALTADGEDGVGAASPYAAKWCAVGCKEKALYHLGLMEYDDEFQKFMDYYAREYGKEVERGYTTVVTLNDDDNTTFEDVRLFVKCLKDKEIVTFKHPVCNCADCREAECEE